GNELKNFARDVGVSPRSVNAWRSLEDIPDGEHRAALAPVLDKPIKVIEDACELDRAAKATRSNQPLGPQGYNLIANPSVISEAPTTARISVRERNNPRPYATG